MGFGKLLIGYFISFVLPIGLGNYSFLGIFIGAFIMYFALTELKKYGPVFTYAYITDIVYILFAMFLAVYGILNLFDVATALKNYDNIINMTRIVVECVFNFLLIYGIMDMCRRVELDDLRRKAFFCFFPVAAFNILQVGEVVYTQVVANGENVSQVIAYLKPLEIVLALVYMISNMYVIFNCYAFICPKGDEDMKRKPSRFAFINKLHEKEDARDEKAREEAVKYYEEKKQKKAEKHKKKRG